MNILPTWAQLAAFIYQANKQKFLANIRIILIPGNGTYCPSDQNNY